MFYYCESLKGAVPTFAALSYPILNIVTGYLTGVKKENITNANNLETRLIPSDWI